jgi:hypothetical protein
MATGRSSTMKIYGMGETLPSVFQPQCSNIAKSEFVFVDETTSDCHMMPILNHPKKDDLDQCYFPLNDKLILKKKKNPKKSNENKNKKLKNIIKTDKKINIKSTPQSEQAVAKPKRGMPHLNQPSSPFSNSVSDNQEEGLFLTQLVCVYGNDVIIGPRATSFIETNIILNENLSLGSYRKIEPAYDDWLYNEMSRLLLVKTGVLSNNSSGRLKVMVYNKTTEPITIAVTSPIALLITQKYEY